MVPVSNCRIDLHVVVLITGLQKDPPEAGLRDCWSYWILWDTTSSPCDPDIPSTFDLLAHSWYLVDVWLSGQSLCSKPTAKRGRLLEWVPPLWLIYATTNRLSRQRRMFRLVLPCVKASVASQAPALTVLPDSMLPQYSPTWSWPPSPPGRHLNESPCPVEMSWSFCHLNSPSWLSTNSTFGRLLGSAELSCCIHQLRQPVSSGSVNVGSAGEQVRGWDWPLFGSWESILVGESRPLFLSSLPTPRSHLPKTSCVGEVTDFV